MTSSPPIIAGLSEIASRYDTAICDVWGVVHNGRTAFRTAIEAMRRFREHRGPVVLLSNAPRPDYGVKQMFDRLSIPHDFYDEIVTSGGEARADLMRRTESGSTLRLFHLGPTRDNPLYGGLNISIVGADEADVVLCTGLYDDENETAEDYRTLLESFKRHELPFLCANPDIVVQRGDRLVYCAGAIARLYESMGGNVIYYGKPYAPVFEASLRAAAKHGPALHPLVIGDGPETDIIGANRLNIDALFIVGGIHGAELLANPSAAGAILAKSGAQAIGIMPELKW